MPTVDIGANSYEVYADLDTHNQYLAASPFSANWLAADPDPTQAQWAVTATRTLDRQRWPGEKTDPDQGNAWPRTGTGIDGVEDDDVPQDIIFAEIELANALANGYDAVNQQTTDAAIKSLKAGSVAIEYFGITIGGTPLRFPLPVWELIKPYLGGAGTAAGVESFGTCEPSSFCPDYGLGRAI